MLHICQQLAKELQQSPKKVYFTFYLARLVRKCVLQCTSSGTSGLGSKVRVASHWLVTTTPAGCSFPLLRPPCSPLVFVPTRTCGGQSITRECFAGGYKQGAKYAPFVIDIWKLFLEFSLVWLCTHHWSLRWWIKIWKWVQRGGLHLLRNDWPRLGESLRTELGDGD